MLFLTVQMLTSFQFKQSAYPCLSKNLFVPPSKDSPSEKPQPNFTDQSHKLASPPPVLLLQLLQFTNDFLWSLFFRFAYSETRSQVFTLSALPSGLF